MPSAAHQPSAEFAPRPPCHPDVSGAGGRGPAGRWALEQSDRARVWDQLPHGRGPPRSDYGQDPGSPLFGAGALGSWCGSSVWDGPRRLVCGLEGQATLDNRWWQGRHGRPPPIHPARLPFMRVRRTVYARTELAMSVDDAANPAERERRKLLLELYKPHCIGLPLGPVMLLQSGEKLGLDPLRAGPLVEQLACDLILDLKVRQGREHILQLGQEVLRVDWDLGRMDEGFRADEGV